jgi:tRNA (cmo5U34)-methyltransferase
MSGRAARIVEHFEGEAPIFDELIVKLIPRYGEMIDALVWMLPFAAGDAMRVLDLGCGTGGVGARVLQQFPRACITCVDVAPPMLERARAKLAGSRDARFVCGDFRAGLEQGPFDAIVSSLALHHIETDEVKLAFYRDLLRALTPGGAFWNADVVLGASAAEQARYLERWTGFMTASVGERETHEVWLPKHRDEDRPARLVDHLRWLEQVGFVDVDVAWKWFGFAVYGGRRA